MYERFTDRARQVMQLANEEALRRRHEYIDTEHVLLGLLKEGSGTAVQVLKGLEVDVRKLGLEIEKLFPSGSNLVYTGKLPQTPRTKKVVEQSMVEARNLNHNYVGTEHFLLGLLHEQESVAARVLMSLGLTLENVRQEVLDLLGQAEAADRVATNPSKAVAADAKFVVEWRERYEFTPGAERALLAAAAWENAKDARNLYPEEVLLGLLAEPECRAAMLLAKQQIGAADVQARFSNLAPPAAPVHRSYKAFSPEMRRAAEAAQQRLIDYPKPLHLATEHLLLGIAAAEGEVARWLSERGLDVDALEAEVHRISGHQPGPLQWDGDDEHVSHVHLSASPELIDAAMAGSMDVEAETSPSEQVGALRVLDAAANRASEGLRVVEDYLRFVLDDRHLTGVCKDIRHGLTAALAPFSSLDRHAARETRGDVGTDVTLPAEQQRAGTGDVLQANFKRVEQALRSLEEYSKTVEPGAAAALEQLRYRVYTLERATDITRDSSERLAGARLYVLVDGGASEDEFRQRVESLVAAGVSVIQLRDKQLADRELLARARVLRELTADSDTLFIMNDRADLAALAGADGVHVGQEELSVKDARRILGLRGLIGVSTHSIEQAREAVLDGANYIGVGPTFPSGTKDFAKFTGCELLSQVAGEIRLPAFAIGGVTLDNLPEVLASGMTRVAVSGAIASAVDPAAAARKLLEALDV